MIVALYKIWRGREFLVPSIRSIYDHCDYIVFVSSEIGWNGEKGNNTLEVVEKFKMQFDWGSKIIIIKHDTVNQCEQYDVGREHIRNHITQDSNDWILLIDSDEVWEEIGWNNALIHINSSAVKTLARLNCVMRTYIKTVFYTINETEQAATPAVLLRASLPTWPGVRANAISRFSLMRDVLVHHFALVRDNEAEVFKKIQTSQIGDKFDQLVDMVRWKRDVWDKMPNGRCAHYYKGCEHIWTSWGTATINDIPEQVKIQIANNQGEPS